MENQSVVAQLLNKWLPRQYYVWDDESCIAIELSGPQNSSMLKIWQGDYLHISQGEDFFLLRWGETPRLQKKNMSRVDYLKVRTLKITHDEGTFVYYEGPVELRSYPK